MANLAAKFLQVRPARPPQPWQVPVLSWLKVGADRDLAGLYLDKRLGKCYCAAWWVCTRVPLPKIGLVVAPISAWRGWEDDLKEDGFTALFLEGNKQARFDTLQSYSAINDLQGKPLFFITNPEGLYETSALVAKLTDKAKERSEPNPTEIARFPYDFVIWDESVKLANPKSQVNRIAFKAFTSTSPVPFRLILSGEFVPQHHFQAFEQQRWISPDLRFMGERNFWNWRNKNFINEGYDWIPKLGFLKQMHDTIGERCYILSRKSAGLGNFKTFEQRTCYLPETLAMEYRRLQRLMVVENPDGEHMLCPVCEGEGEKRIDDSTSSICPICNGDGEFNYVEAKYAVQIVNWLRQIAGGYPSLFPHLHSDHKIELLKEVLSDYRREPVVVSFAYNDEIDVAFSYLKKNGFQNLRRAYGRLPPEQTKMQIREFRAHSRGCILLAQVKQIMYGLNLSNADIMVRYSLPYSWNEISQSMDRIEHPDKKRPLLYQTLVTKGTIDEDIYAVAQGNMRRSGTFMQQVLGKLKRRV